MGAHPHRHIPGINLLSIKKIEGLYQPYRLAWKTTKTLLLELICPEAV